MKVAVTHSLSPDHCVAIWEDVLFVIWRRAVTSFGVSAVREALLKQIQERGGNLGVIIVVEEHVNIAPDPEVRKALAKCFAEREREIISVAMVHEAAGFRAALVRAVVTAITLMMSSPTPHRVFASVPPAAAWLAKQAPALKKTPGAIAHQLQQLRSRINSAPQ
jgi:hypothetical protein